jgi:hypothetical protein
MPSTHRASEYISKNITLGLVARDLAIRQLTSHEAGTLRLSLVEDARNYFVNAAYSIAGAVDALRKEMTTWPTVQLYYSVFYSLRGVLALHGYCAYYLGKRPFILEALVGKSFRKPSGGKQATTTHGCVLRGFKSAFPSHYLVSQQIGVEDPLEWITDRRVEANYVNARFWEPAWPEHFAELRRNSLRRLLGAYMQDRTGLYAFDPDHAMLAYPIEAVACLRDELKGKAVLSLDHETKRSISRAFRDSAGAFPGAIQFFD